MSARKSATPATARALAATPAHDARRAAALASDDARRERLASFGLTIHGLRRAFCHPQHATNCGI